jgi:acyl-CoA reductase-like NAD-dependent aldehyde dehydrogenase
MGQICTATSRILVQDTIYDKFCEEFKKQVKSVSKVGDPFKDETFQGPQVTKAQYEKVLGYIESGKSEGATLATGGEAYKDVNGKGFFISPTVFTNVKDNMKIYREEVFGPLSSSRASRRKTKRWRERMIRRMASGAQCSRKTSRRHIAWRGISRRVWCG